MAELFMTVGSNTMSDLNGAGVTMTVNGVPATVGLIIYVGDMVRVQCDASRMFFWQEGDNRNSTFFDISTGAQHFSFSDDYKSGWLTTRPINGGTVHWLTVQTQANYTPTANLYIIKQSDLDEMAACNVTGTLRSTAVVVGKPVYTGNVITLTAGGSALFTTHTGNFQYPVYMGYATASGGTGRLAASISSDKKTATLTVTAQANKLQKLVVITYTGTAPTDGTEYIIQLEDVKEMADNGVTLNVGGLDKSKAWSRIKRGETLQAVADTSREFYPTSSPTTASIYFVVGAMGDDSYIPFTIGTDKRNASLAVPSRLLSAQPINRIETNTQQWTPDVTGNNKVYLINNEKLADVNKERFQENIDSGEVFDYGQYILSVINLPFTIDPLYVLAAEPIQLATLKLSTTANIVAVDVIELDLGEINVTGEFSDFRDYTNTTAILHLPRVASFAIDLEYVINQTISIKYLIDVYNGRATVNIHSTYVDSTIISKEVDIGVKVPFINANAFSVENSNVDVGGNNEILRPFIEVVRSSAILADGVFSVPVVDEDLLNTATGFIEVQNIDLKTKALQSEQSEIVSKLTNGVIIK